MSLAKPLLTLFIRVRKTFWLFAIPLLIVFTVSAPVPSTPASAAGLITGLTVNDAANAADWSIQPAIGPGDLQYGDRGYALMTVPASVAGSEWIRTANDSKSFTGSTLVSFTVTSAADVCVALNDRILAQPPWLGSANGWTDTQENLVNNESPPRTFSLFRKSFPAGARVALGNNGSTTSGLYTVIVKPTGPPNQDFEPRNLVSPSQAQTDTSI